MRASADRPLTVVQFLLTALIVANLFAGLWSVAWNGVFAGVNALLMAASMLVMAGKAKVETGKWSPVVLVLAVVSAVLGAVILWG